MSTISHPFPAALPASTIGRAGRGGGSRRSGRLVRLAASALSIGAAAVGFFGSGEASATTAVSYGSALYCISITSAVGESTWQQQLEGTVPTTTTETLYSQPPTALVDYVGTAAVTWSARIVYAGTDGRWHDTNATMSTSARSFQYLGGRLQFIQWGVGAPRSFVTGVTPGERYGVLATVSWLNSRGAVIASITQYLPNYNC